MSIIVVPFVSDDPNLPTLVSPEPEASQYRQAILTATSATLITDAIAQEDLDLIDDFIVKMKIASINGVQTNILGKLKYFMPLAGKTLTAALVPLVGAAGTNNAYVSGDYNETNGLQGNGTSKSVNMPAALNTYGSFIGKIIRVTAVSNTAVHDVINPGFSASSVSATLIRTSLAFFGYQNAGEGFLNANITAAPGTYSDNVRSGNYSGYINGALFQSDTGGGTVPTQALQLFRNGNRYGCFALTNAMSEAEFLKTDELITDLMVAMGR